MRGEVRSLAAGDLPWFRGALAADPVAHCFVASRLEAIGARVVSDVSVYAVDGHPLSALYLGSNVIPIDTDDESREAFATQLARSGRRGSSMVGPAHEVLDLWGRVRHAWGRPREERRHQPLLSIARDSPVAGDERVRPVRIDELDLLLPACVAMFTEEVGVSPLSGGAAGAYRARIAELIREGRAYALIDEDEVVFKAEVGAASTRACQVQGVWVAPDRRGQGLSTPGMAAVVKAARHECAPVVTLYVNDYNEAARRCYHAVGFEEVGEFATILF
ncbi:MAG: GNAT family N-acetyltransferase [Actinobacteria bacterium]|nr:GNAT family N-acetyltransferase [Actinomycetota bacterium]